MNEPTGSAATSKSATSHRHHYHWDWHYGTGAPVNSPSYYPASCCRSTGTSGLHAAGTAGSASPTGLLVLLSRSTRLLSKC